MMPGFWGYDGESPTPAEAAQNQKMHGVDSPAEVAAGQPYGGFFLRPEVIADADQVRRLAGLPEQMRVITVGQGFVRAGDKVRPVPEEALGEGAAPPPGVAS